MVGATVSGSLLGFVVLTLLGIISGGIAPGVIVAALVVGGILSGVAGVVICGIFCVTVAGALLVSVVLPLLGSALSAFPAGRLVGYITSPIRAVCGAVIRATGSVLRVT